MKKKKDEINECMGTEETKVQSVREPSVSAESAR